MSLLSLVLLVVGLLGLAVGALLSWVELLAVGFGVALLGVASLLVRAPVAARWWQVEVPIRVMRGDAASIRLRVEVTGPGRWVRAVAASSGQAWAVPQSGEIAWPIDTSRRGLHAVGPDRLEFADRSGCGASCSPSGSRRRCSSSPGSPPCWHRARLSGAGPFATSVWS